MVGALLFTTIVFLPALSEGPLGYDATLAGLAISPAASGRWRRLLAVGYLIDKIHYRVLLVIGMVITAGAFELISRMSAQGGEIWLAGASTIQGVGVGLLFTPLSTLAYSSLGAGLRTDAAGVYSLLRRLGCASGVAAMTAFAGKDRNQYCDNCGSTRHRKFARAAPVYIAVFGAYTGCFRTMAIITGIVFPGVFMFRVARPDPAVSSVAQSCANKTATNYRASGIVTFVLWASLSGR